MARAILAAALAFALLATSSPSYGEQPAKVYHIGFLAINPPASSDRTARDCPANGTNWEALVQGLRERGYAQGQNLVIECRATEGREERALPLATELLSLKVDLLIVSGSANVRAAKQ